MGLGALRPTLSKAIKGAGYAINHEESIFFSKNKHTIVEEDGVGN